MSLNEHMKPQTKIEIQNQIRTLREALQDMLEITDQNENQVVLHVIRPEYKSKEPFPWTNLVLFLLTVVTTFAAGAMMRGENFISNPLLILNGWSFAVPLLLILLCHEFGHYI